jgi:nucleoside-diphosphate-sugar epimerase
MTLKKLTVFGAGGFIGSNIKKFAPDYGYKAVSGNWKNIDFSEPMGDVIYCLGVGDCNNPDEVINSHLRMLQKIVNYGFFDRLTYVSSTRVYMGSNVSNEFSNLTIDAKDNRKLFNLIKLTAESYLQSSKIDYRIVRPSNVFGSAINSPLFLPSIVRDAVTTGQINMFVDPFYSKDYIHVDDVSNLILQISKNSKNKTYNLASGNNISAKDITKIIEKYTNCSINWHDTFSAEKFPITDISLIKNEFSFQPKLVTETLKDMIYSFKDELEK